MENLILLGIAGLNAYTALLAYRTHQAALATQINVAVVEKATNSMKDALVKATGEKEHAAGVEVGRKEARAEAKEDKHS